MRKNADRVGQQIGRTVRPEAAPRMCFGKRSFESKNAARDFGIKTAKRVGRALDAYKCPVCQEWHLTSLDKESSAQARRKAWKK